MGLFSKLFASDNNKKLKELYKIVDRIEELESSIQSLSD